MCVKRLMISTIEAKACAALTIFFIEGARGSGFGVGGEN
jgi:hypothetical protein